MCDCTGTVRMSLSTCFRAKERCALPSSNSCIHVLFTWCPIWKLESWEIIIRRPEVFENGNIERIGDHSTNIAETIYYLVKGEPLAGQRPKDDRSSFAIIEPPAADGRK